MIFSTKHSYLVLRIGLAAVFFWLGADKFFHPASWLTLWVPDSQFVYIIGIFEVLIGLSFVTGVFMRFFALLGIIALIVHAFPGGIGKFMARDAGLIGGLLAILLWPEHGSR